MAINLSHRRTFRHPVVFVLLFAALLAGCAAPTTPAAPTAAPAPAQTNTPLPSATPAPRVLPTATSRPPTPTAEPTRPPALAVLTDGFTAWCLPLDFYARGGKDAQPGIMPEGATAGKLAFGEINLLTPALSCSVVYQFNQPAPEGIVLEVYDGLAAAPWLSVPLATVAAGSSAASAALTHPYIVSPPYYGVSYRLVVKSPAGEELRADKVRFYQPAPEICWEGSTPDPNTLYCPPADYREPEPHPEATSAAQPTWIVNE